MVFLELFFVLALTGINGLLAMSELALVSARRSRLDQMSARGSRGARAALRLLGDPGRFLSTVQIGITLIGILAGAFGGATLADRLGDWLDTLPGLAPNGDAVAIAVVVVAITYLSLVVGELVPKRIAMASPERVAAAVARPMSLLSRATGPAVWLLKSSTEAVLRILQVSGEREETVTQEEIRALVAEGVRAGVFAPQAREMIDGVLRLAERSVRVIMTPRPEIVWIDIHADAATLQRTVEASRYSRLLVCEGSVDRAVGVLYAKHVLPQALRGRPVDLGKLMVPALFVPDRMPVLKLIDRFRREGLHMAVVVDEYGMTEGLVTPTDILESIAGGLPQRGDPEEPRIVQRSDGTWLVDGAMPLDELEDTIGLHGLLAEGGYHTVAGLVLHQLGHLPAQGESFSYRDARFEVVDMDGRSIDKVLVERRDRPDPFLILLE